MTALFRLDQDALALARYFAAHAGQDPWSGGHIAPGGFAPIITAGREHVAGPRPTGEPTRRVIPRLWGVPPPPSVRDHSARGILSARNLDSPFWIGNLRNSEFRCLVPATSFMEWGKGKGGDGKRASHWFGCADQTLFAFAGVWTDSEVPSFALITCEANAALRHIGQDRMPVILPADSRAWNLWLQGDWARAQKLIVPYSSSLMIIR